MRGAGDLDLSTPAPPNPGILSRLEVASMKHRLSKLSVVLLVVALLAGVSAYAGINYFTNNAVAATSTSQNVAFGFVASTIKISNNSASANPIFVRWTGGTATTSDDEYFPGETVTLNFPSSATMTSVSIVCAATQTATVRVTAIGEIQ